MAQIQKLSHYNSSLSSRVSHLFNGHLKKLRLAFFSKHEQTSTFFVSEQTPLIFIIHSVKHVQPALPQTLESQSLLQSSAAVCMLFPPHKRTPKSIYFTNEPGVKCVRGPGHTKNCCEGLNYARWTSHLGIIQHYCTRTPNKVPIGGKNQRIIT